MVSLHVPLAFGRLKFKSESRLRQREKDGRATVRRFGSLYVVWEARSKNAEPDGNDSKEIRMWRDQPKYVATLIYRQGSLDERAVERTAYTATDPEDAKTKAWAWAGPLITPETTSLQVAIDRYAIMSVPVPTGPEARSRSADVIGPS
jgi:hypothetical protein